MQKIVFLIFVSIFTLFLTGVKCSSKKQKISSTPKVEEKVMIEEENKNEELPTRDNSKSGISEIPYLPNSTKIALDKSDDFEEITYQVKETKEKIINYYVAALPQKGFELVFETEEMVSFKKDKIVTIDIQILDEIDGITTYKITYWTK